MMSDDTPSGSEADRPRLTDFRFGSIAVWGRLLEEPALEEALREQSGRRAGEESAPRIGEILIERGLLTDEEVRRILRVQLQRMPAAGHLLFGRIAVARRFAPPAAVFRALDEQSREILASRGTRRLGEILVSMGEVRPEEVEAILAYQARADSVPMSEARKKAAPPSDEPPAPPPAEAAAVEASADVTGPAQTARPDFLPRGARGFVLDNSIWIACLLAAALAAALAVFREAIFG